ncbi:MAG: GNAT family N-acetyltransferase, partial [Oscillospiraceae bacterium]|nr:GNAT family N-acetyltransferase [Oscillospiraceae bacterium]
MDFTVKLASYSDMAEAGRVEKETMGSYTYLEDAWHYFSTLPGGMVCVSHGDKMVGIGRFSVSPDGSGWLETLRVVPEYQRKGVGREIYKKYVQLAQENGCPSMAMFTGTENVASSALAELFGLKTSAQH